MANSSNDLKDEFEGLDPFDIDVQFGFFMKRMYGHSVKEMPSAQIRQLQQAFFGAWGQCLVIMRDGMPSDEDEAVQKLIGMWDQVGKYWTKNLRGNN